MTKGDYYTKEILQKIIDEGCWDKDPRPHYEDVYKNAIYDKECNLIVTEDYDVIDLNCNQTVFEYPDKVVVWTPAHTKSVNSYIECNYDLSRWENPLITLRPIAMKTSIAEILWIYQMESTDLVEFDTLLGYNTWEKEGKISNWWEEWALRDEFGNYILNEKGHPHIGSTYGQIIKELRLVVKRLEEMKKNPDGRRHIISMWQDGYFELPHGLKPCAFMTIWNIRHENSGDYLDMTLIQRSSDFCTAGCINQTQYTVLLMLFARHLGLQPGIFTWKPVNVQIYDRHEEQSMEMIAREPVDCTPYIWLNPEKKNFYDFKLEDIEVRGYPKKLIKEKNPQLPFPLGI